MHSGFGPPQKHIMLHTDEGFTGATGPVPPGPPLVLRQVGSPKSAYAQTEFAMEEFSPSEDVGLPVSHP